MLKRILRLVLFGWVIPFALFFDSLEWCDQFLFTRETAIPDKFQVEPFTAHMLRKLWTGDCRVKNRLGEWM